MLDLKSIKAKATTSMWLHLFVTYKLHINECILYEI